MATTTSRTISEAIQCLTNGKRLSPSLVHHEFLSSLAQELDLQIHKNQISPSRCAHVMCLSAANGYSEIVEILSQKNRNTFNKAYTFEEPLARAIRSWLKAKNQRNVETQIRCGSCAKYLVAAGADIHFSEKYLKKPLTPAQRLQNDASREALELYKDLLRLTEDRSEAEREVKAIGEKAADGGNIETAKTDEIEEKEEQEDEEGHQQEAEQKERHEQEVQEDDDEQQQDEEEEHPPAKKRRKDQEENTV
jgi:hypothetical protein